jgi:hypothetical protein
MHDQMHALGVIEEALEHDVVVRGHDAEHRSPGSDVVDDLVDRRLLERRRTRQPRLGQRDVARGEMPGDRLSQPRHLPRQLGGAGRRLTSPERDRGWLALGVDDPDDAAHHLADLPRMGAQQEDVAGH